MNIDKDDLETSVAEQGSQLIHTILISTPTDFSTVQKLIQGGAPLWYQEDEGGMSALHAACYVENPEIVQALIDAGALWNCVDDQGNTAGDVALSLNDEDSYRIIRDAGIRSEYLLQLLSAKAESPIKVLQATDSGPFGSTEAFLKAKLHFTTDSGGQEICTVMSGDTSVGVMMGWERGIMKTTVDMLCMDHPGYASGLRILNVGFGLGIIDSLFQALDPPPMQHTIIEPHPDVLAHMHERGWYDRPGVSILEGRWQEFVDNGEIYGEGGWDVVYVDTFAEGYEELRKFFDIVPDLLSGPDARFSFFNGLGATNSLFYDVYTQLSELHLKNGGMEVTWGDVDVDGAATVEEDDRWGETKAYFKARLYRLPVAKMVQI